MKVCGKYLAGVSFLAAFGCASKAPIAGFARHPASLAIPATESDAASVIDAQKLMAIQNQKFDSGIYATSSFSNDAALGTFIQHANPAYLKAWNILQNEDVDVTVAMPERMRALIVTSGFKNTHETGTSGGVADSDLRDRVEAAYLGIALDRYKSSSSNIKPKSAFLAPKPNSPSAGLSSPYAIWNYGEDRYILNMEHIRNRLSLTPGDSLNNMYAFANDGSRQVPPDWYHRVVPWLKRALLSPVLAQAISTPLSQGSGDNLSQTFGSTLGTRVWYFEDTESNVQAQGGFGGFSGGSCNAQALSDNHGDEQLKIKFAMCSVFDSKVRGLEKYCTGCSWSMDYIEAQIWGALTIDDVQAFAYSQNPPSGEFLNSLIAHHIEIRDERQKKGH